MSQYNYVFTDGESYGFMSLGCVEFNGGMYEIYMHDDEWGFIWSHDEVTLPISFNDLRDRAEGMISFRDLPGTYETLNNPDTKLGDICLQEIG